MAVDAAVPARPPRDLAGPLTGAVVLGGALQVPTYAVSLAGKHPCYAVLALAVGLVWGFAGILSLGHAASCIAWVRQGRDISPLLTVRENLETGFGAAGDGGACRTEVFEPFPALRAMLRRRGGDPSDGQQRQLATARALAMRPRMLALDEPTEGIQPSIIEEIGWVIAPPHGRGTLAILLAEQYDEFARELAQTIAMMERGSIALSGPVDALDEADARR